MTFKIVLRDNVMAVESHVANGAPGQHAKRSHARCVTV